MKLKNDRTCSHGRSYKGTYSQKDHISQDKRILLSDARGGSKDQAGINIAKEARSF